MNRRGFLSSIAAGVITAAAVTRLATTKLELAALDDGISLNAMAHPVGNPMLTPRELTEKMLEELCIEIREAEARSMLNPEYMFLRYTYQTKDGAFDPNKPIKVEHITREEVFVPWENPSGQTEQRLA